MRQDLISDPEAIAALRRADALHTSMTHIVLEGGALDAIAEAVGTALGYGVVFTSTDGRERAAHLDAAQREMLADADLLDPTGRLRVERIDPDGTTVGSGQALLRRVVAAGVDLARLVALKPDGTIHDSDVHALERAAIVAALLVTRGEAITAVENKYQGDFLRDVFLGRAGDADYVAEHARAFGWQLDRPVVVVVAVQRSAKLERLVRAVETRTLAGQLRARGGADWTAYQRLLECERWVP